MLTELVDKVYEFNLYLAKLQKNDPSVDQLSFRMDFVLQGNDNWQQKIANALKDNTNVTSLDLSRNPSFGDDGAKELTQILRDNKYITKVNLSATKLGHGGCEALAEALRTNEAITELNISENPDMKDGLDALLDSLKYNRTLRTLDLSGDQIGPSKVEKIGAALQANATLFELNLSNNVLRSEGAEDLFAVLRTPNVHLKHLDVSQNELEPDCVSAVASAIRLNSSLESLSMRGNPIGHCLAPIIQALSKNATLKKLDLSSTGIGRKGESEFAQLLEHLKLRTRAASRIQVLDDSEPGQQSPTNVPDDSTLQSSQDERKHDKKRKSSKRRIAQQQQEDDDHSHHSHHSGKSTNSTDLHISKDNRCALEELILARNNIEGMRLITALKTNETLTALSLASNPLSQDSFDTLLNLLSTSNSLNSVDLSEVGLIGDKEAVQFADLLKNEAVIISGLSLARTRIEERGSHTLLEAVKKNKTLISLNMKGVRISAEDVKDITNWFVTSPTMFILEVDQDDKKGLLRTKNLEHLGLTRFPPALFKMTNLQRLNISNNQITEIPDAIAHLKELRELDVSNNRLVALPPALGQLKDTLKSLRFHNNPLKTPPRDIIHKPVKIILGYLKDLQGGFEDIYRVKMMVVGQENVGKTTLLKLLSKKARKKMPKKPREDDKEGKSKPIAMLHSKKGLRKYLSTDGIDIADVTLEVTFDEEGRKVKRPVTVSTWDFAGQEIYYTTHEFFLSDHSVFLLVWDLSKDEQDSRVAFWLNSIHSRAPNAPIILVGTHLDDPVCLREGYVENVLKNLKEKYKPRFPMLKHAFAVSCAWSNADGMIALLDSIRVTVSEMSIMGQSIPKTYLALENVIREEKRVCNPPYKSWRSFSQMAALCNIKGDELKRSAEVLHAMGSIVWFDDPKLGLNDLVILDCKYLTNIFATIITTKHNYIKDGILPHSVLRHIWKPPQYPLEIHTQLLQLLEKFEIAYRLDQSSLRGRSSSFSLDVPAKAHFAPGDLEFSLVPSLLPIERPNIDVLWRKYDLSQVQYDRICEFEFLPKALFSRLMVRLLYYADKIHKYWRKGLVASADDTLFLLEMFPTKNRIQVTVRGGKNPGAVLKDLIETIEGFIVLTNWWQINVTRKITCPHCLQELSSLYNPQDSDSESESVSTVSRSLRTSFDDYSNKATLHRFDRKEKEKEKKKGKSKHKKFPKKPVKQQRHSISVAETSSQELIAASVSNSSPDLFEPTMFELAECERAASAGVWFLRCHGIHPVRLDALAPDITLSDHERFKIPYDELHLGEEIGTGTYGNIKKAEWQGQIVAVKQLKREEEGPGEREKVFNDFRREVWIMSGIKHPNVVNLIGFCLQPQFCLVMEFLPCGDLYSFIHNKEQALDLPRVLKIALDIACGMRHLHSATPPFVHRDLKSPNILMVDSDPTKPVMAKVGDFGLSSRMFVPYLRETMRHRLVENPTWLAPEITREEEFNEKSDIYAYGIILWELLTRKHPFEDWGFNFMFELEDAVKLEKKRPDIPAEAPEVLTRLVRTCWEDDPSVRPSFTEIMELLITLVNEQCPGKVTIPPTYYVGTRWESEYVTEDVHRTLSTTHDSARKRVSRTNLQYNNNNTEDNDFDPSPASLKLQGRFFKKLKWYNPDVEIVELLSVPENQIWAGGSDGSVSIWNSLSGELVDRNYDVHRNSPITAMITIGQGTVAPATSMTQLTRHASNSQVTTHNTGVSVWTCGQLDDKINIWAVRPLEQQTNLLVTSQNMIAMLFVKIDGANKDKSWKQRICQIKDKQLLVHEAEKLLHVLELEGNNHGVADPFAHGENCFYLDSPEPARYYFQVPHQDSFQDWLMVLKAWQNPTSLDGNMIRLASIQNTHTIGLTYLVEVSGHVWSGDTRGNICVWDVKERRLLKRLKLFREDDTDVPSTTKVRTMLYFNLFVWVAIEKYLYCIDPVRYSMVSTVVMPSGINSMIGVKLATGKKLWVALQDSTIKVFDIEGLKDYRRKYSATSSTPVIEVHDESRRISTRLAIVDKHGEESSPSIEHKGNNTNLNNGNSDNDLTPVRKTSRKHREAESKQLRRHQRADFPCIKTMGPIALMGVQDFVNIQSNWIWSAGDDGVIRIWNASTYEMFAVLEKKHDGPITMMILWGTTVWSASKGGTICIWT